MAGSFLRQALGSVLVYSGASSLLRPFLGGLGAILMFHRVLPEGNSGAFCPTQGLTVAPDQFREICRSLLSSGYEIVSLDEARDRILSGKNARRFACLTFDDGYRDNYEIAHPICAEFGIPMTVYVTTGLIDGTADMWWYGLEALINRNQSIRFSHRGHEREHVCGSSAEKSHAYWQMVNLFRTATAQEKAALTEHFKDRYGVDFAAISRGQAMTWEMVWELSRRDGVEIGAHTVTHPGLSTLGLEAARDEIERSRRILEERITRPVSHFAYPFGDPETVGEREFDLCRELGFATATTTRTGNLTSSHKDSLHNLPRIPVWSFETRQTLAAKLSGSYAFLAEVYRGLVPASPENAL